MDSKWYVLRCPSGQEETIAWWLLRNTRIERALTPAEILMHRLQCGEFVERRRMIFPGYIFVRLVLTGREYYRIVYNDYRKVTFLGANGKPETVSDAEMEIVLYLDNNGEDFGVSQGRRGQHQRAIVTDGPLAPLQEYITQVSARQRVASLRIPLQGRDHKIKAAIIMEDKHRGEPGGLSNRPGGDARL